MPNALGRTYKTAASKAHFDYAESAATQLLQSAQLTIP